MNDPRHLSAFGLPTPAERYGPRLRDYLLLFVSALFAATGIWIVASGRDAGVGLARAAFFGLCTALFGGQVAEKRRDRTLASATRVEVAGGEPLRASKARFAGLAAALLAVGATGVAAGPRMGARFTLLTAGVAAVGAAMLAALAKAVEGSARDPRLRARLIARPRPTEGRASES